MILKYIQNIFFIGIFFKFGTKCIGMNYYLRKHIWELSGYMFFLIHFGSSLVYDTTISITNIRIFYMYAAWVFYRFNYKQYTSDNDYTIVSKLYDIIDVCVVLFGPRYLYLWKWIIQLILISNAPIIIYEIRSIVRYIPNMYVYDLYVHKLYIISCFICGIYLMPNMICVNILHIMRYIIQLLIWRQHYISYYL